MKKTVAPVLAAIAVIAASLVASSCQNALNPEAPAATTSSPSSDASLSALSISAGDSVVTLSPAFAAATTTYTATVANAVDSLTVAATANDSGAKLSGAGAASLAVGANSISVIVTAADGTTKKTYTITVTRLALYDTTLSNLRIVNGDMSVALSSEFSGGKADYSARLPNDCSTLRIYATPADPKATATIFLGASPLDVATTTLDDSTDPIFTSSATVAEGLNEVSIVVTGSDGLTKKTYTISATKVAAGLSSEARLESLGLTANGSPLVLVSMGGKGEFVAYQAFVASSVTSVVVAAKPRDPNAIVYGNGETSLAMGKNRLRVVVTAANGEAIWTTIFVVRDKVAGIADYVGTWSGREASSSGDYTATIGSDGAVSLTIAYSDFGSIYNGKAAVDASTGVATVTSAVGQSYTAFVYDSVAGTLDTLDDNFYHRVGTETGSLLGKWATTGDYYTLDFKADGTFTYVFPSSSGNGIWDNAKITFIRASDFTYTLYVSPASPTSMLFQNGPHEECALAKK